MNKYLMDCLDDYEKEISDLKSFLKFADRHPGEEYQDLFNRNIKARLECIDILHKNLNNLLKP